MKTHIDPDESFLHFFQRLRDKTFNMLEYQSIPLELICSRLKIKYPAISVLFNMVNTGNGDLGTIPDVEAHHQECVQDSKFEIVYYLKEYRNGIGIECHYYKNLFKPARIEMMVKMYTKVLEKICIEPAKPLKEYSFGPKKRIFKRKSKPRGRREAYRC